MITDIMMKLERHFYAWFITRNDIREDDETVVRNYHVFTEDDILIVCFNEKLDYEKSFQELASSAEKASDLEYWYGSLLVVANKLDDERKQRLLTILEPIKPKYEDLCKKLYPHLTQQK